MAVSRHAVKLLQSSFTSHVMYRPHVERPPGSSREGLGMVKIPSASGQDAKSTIEGR